MSGMIMHGMGTHLKRAFKVINSHDSAANKKRGKEKLEDKRKANGGLIDDEFCWSGWSIT